MLRKTVVLFVAILLAACSDSPIEPEINLQPSVNLSVLSVQSSQASHYTECVVQAQLSVTGGPITVSKVRVSSAGTGGPVAYQDNEDWLGLVPDGVHSAELRGGSTNGNPGASWITVSWAAANGVPTETRADFTCAPYPG